MDYDSDNDEPQSFLQRHRWLMVLGVVALFGGVGYGVYSVASQPSGSKRTTPDIVAVKLPPPPPPPVRPPPPPQQQQQPKEEPTKPNEVAPIPDDVKPEENKEADKPDEPAPSVDLASAESAPGESGMVVAKGTGRGLGVSGSNGTGTGGGRSGGKYDYYFSQIKKQVKEALASNAKTSKASIDITVRIWTNATGEIVRAALSRSTGDASLDAAIKNDVLTGMQLKDATPKDLKMPIILTLKILRPNT